MHIPFWKYVEGPFCLLILFGLLVLFLSWPGQPVNSLKGYQLEGSNSSVGRSTFVPIGRRLFLLALAPPLSFLAPSIPPRGPAGSWFSLLPHPHMLFQQLLSMLWVSGRLVSLLLLPHRVPFSPSSFVAGRRAVYFLSPAPPFVLPTIPVLCRGRAGGLLFLSASSRFLLASSFLHSGLAGDDGVQATWCGGLTQSPLLMITWNRIWWS